MTCKIAVRLITISLPANIAIIYFFSLYLCSPRQTKSILCLLMPCLLASPGHQGLCHWELKRYNQSVSARHDIIAMAYYLFYSKGIFDAKINIVVADYQAPLIVYNWAVIAMLWCKMLKKNQLFLWESRRKIGTSHIFVDAIIPNVGTHING